MRPLCLVGMSGIGKSFWAQRLAAERGFLRHDCDAEIAAGLATLAPVAPGEAPVHALGRWMGMPWSSGYAEREAQYLALEERVTRRALAAVRERSGEHVLDTTGSVIYLPDDLLAGLRETCRVVYLRTPERWRDAMLARYRLEPKPVVWDGAFVPRDGEAFVDALPRCFAELLRRRDERYAALAHVVLDGAALETTPPSVDAWLAACGA